MKHSFSSDVRDSGIHRTYEIFSLFSPHFLVKTYVHAYEDNSNSCYTG